MLEGLLLRLIEVKVMYVVLVVYACIDVCRHAVVGNGVSCTLLRWLLSMEDQASVPNALDLFPLLSYGLEWLKGDNISAQPKG